MGIVVFGAVFVDIKGYPLSQYIPGGRNVGRVVEVHGGVSRNVVEDIANVELRPTFVSLVDETGTGADVIAKLKRHQVNTSYMRRVKDGLGSWLAIFDNSGDVVASISKRPDLSEIGRILDEQGDEIIQNADSIVVEIDMDSSLLRKIFTLADRYHREVYAVVSNMSIAMERRDLLSRCGVVVCNREEAGLLFSCNYQENSPQEMVTILEKLVNASGIRRMVVTLGSEGAVYAEKNGPSGYVPAWRVDVIDTTGCGDAFFAGTAIGLTYGKTLEEACGIGTRLAASVIATRENVCPRFLPSEFGLAISPAPLSQKEEGSL